MCVLMVQWGTKSAVTEAQISFSVAAQSLFGAQFFFFFFSAKLKSEVNDKGSTF